MKLLNHKFKGSTITYYFENEVELIVGNWGNGAKYWYQNGKLHRLDGPAIEYPNGTKYWYQNGKLHRTDGPAYEQPDGGIKQWFIEGKHYSEQAFNQRLKELADLNQT